MACGAWVKDCGVYGFMSPRHLSQQFMATIKMGQGSKYLKRRIII